MQYILSSESEQEIISRLLNDRLFDNNSTKTIIQETNNLISIIRKGSSFTIEKFMQHYNLSTIEGVAIMGLAEGLLRIPDKKIAKELINDKLAGKNWKNYLSKSQSLKEQVISLGLYGAGSFVDLSNLDNILSQIINKITAPATLTILKQAIKFLAGEFIFGENITQGLKTLNSYKDYSVSFDLLGESARTIEQAEKYYNEYLNAIEIIRKSGIHDKTRISLSIKFTALYPRFEITKLADIEQNFLPKLVALIQKIKEANLAVTFDAEEAARLDTYLHVIEKLILHPELKDFNDLGVVLQAYQTKSYKVIDFIIDLAKKSNKRIPLRLVKGAYWDYEIKHAQENNLQYYPVFTKKEYTDYNYLWIAKKIFENHEYLYPQFATHNALTAAGIIELAKGREFEFQKLHGMGKELHEVLVNDYKVRIYAPVGKTGDLLAYLMRRLLENGANACFVNKVNNNMIAPEELAYDISLKTKNILQNQDEKNKIALPQNIYLNRETVMGYELGYRFDYQEIYKYVSKFYNKIYNIGSIINGNEIISKSCIEHFCPAKFAEKIADVTFVNEENIATALNISITEFSSWSNYNVADRAVILRKVADLYEDNKFELYALLIKEGGKTIKDAINEVIEAVDFCRYYANQAEQHITTKALPSPTGEENVLTMHARGVFLCISPWNFPLAIFTGQIVAALVCGNTVIAKPADQTSIIANFAVKLMHKAGVPKAALHLIIATGATVGKCLVTSEDISGITFTGSTATAKIINQTLANRNNGIIPFIAETGGQNAMVVDSSALLEQVTDDVLTSAFYSAGQRCSALRMLYIQEEIYEPLVDMIKGAMELLKIDDTTNFTTDVGPVISKEALQHLSSHIKDMISRGFKLIAAHPQKSMNNTGYFFYPHIIEVNSISDIPDERFGPILHVAKYKADELDKVIEEVNNCGFGLTFGIQSRIEEKIKYISSKIKAGNIYANRSIVGAVVESQPFGGENKSGTGFKAGGPHYLLKFLLERTLTINTTAIGGNIELLR